MKKTITSWVSILLGCFILASGFVFFINPYNIVPGGVYGASIVLHNLFPSVQVGTFGYMFDVPLLILSVVLLGARLGTRTIVAALTTPLLMNLLSRAVYPSQEALEALDPSQLLGGCMDLSDHLMLTSVIGATVIGIGSGIVVRNQATTGGTDIVAKMLRRRYPYINFGTLLFGMNVVVVLTFAFLFKKYDSCMYTMIEMFISSKVVNLVLYGPGVSEVCYIITNNVNAIKSAITCTMGRGVTLLRGEGAWSGKEMQVILCVVKRPEIAQLREVVRSVDEHAFVIVSEAKEVFGRGFGNIYGDD